MLTVGAGIIGVGLLLGALALVYTLRYLLAVLGVLGAAFALVYYVGFEALHGFPMDREPGVWLAWVGGLSLGSLFAGVLCIEADGDA